MNWGSMWCFVLGICCSDGRAMVLELPGLNLTQSVFVFVFFFMLKWTYSSWFLS